MRAMEHKPDTSLHVRLKPELREQLLRLAIEEERPLSSLVRRVLRAELARREQATGRAA